MGAISSLATLGLNAALAQQSARRESGSINAERDRQIREIQRRTAEQRREDQAELRQRLATQRARAGAAGVGGGGSARAIARGLTEEVEAEDQARQQAARRQIDELRRRAESSRRSSLLDVFGGVAGGSLGLLGRSLGRGRSLLDF